MTPGTYRAKVATAEWTRTRGGAEMLVIGYALDGGEQIVDRLVFSPASTPYAIGKMRASGWRGDDLADLSTLGSQPVDLVIEADTYQGQQIMRVKFVNALGARPSTSAPLTDVERRAFAARMRSTIAGLSASQPAAPSNATSPPPPQAPVRGDDDIPF